MRTFPLTSTLGMAMLHKEVHKMRVPFIITQDTKLSQGCSEERGSTYVGSG